MPPRRRLAPISAAALPASRLPLGTPPLVPPRSPASSKVASSSPPKPHSQSTDTDLLKYSQLDGQQDASGNDNESAMAPKDSADVAPTKSIAEAKLERQRKRIQEAEAALTAPAPVPLDRRAQQSRGKARQQWKPFDFTADTVPSNTPSEGGVSVSEVRVNTFRPSSRGSSLSRPMSVLSHRTSETGPSDMERQDSVLTENGFQLYKGRRNRKNVEELSAYADKPEERQTTVEATFDKREIYEIFGNALPGQEFIEENTGFKNGQLQFIQHPNGDVSAHQWSDERFIWENIGQFSNIRKKVEGQLAADRLKGETAYQTLQQNTLAYFRTVAKQREANVMCLPFGPKEIRAAIPEPRIELAAAPTGLKESMQDANRDKVNVGQPEARQQTFMTQWDRQENRNAPGEQQSTHHPNQSYYQPNVQYAPHPDRFNFASQYGLQSSRQDDPFYPSGSYQQIYGGYSYAHPYYDDRGKSSAPTTNFPYPQRSQGLQNDFHFPSTNAMNRRTQVTEEAAHYPDRADPGKKVLSSWQLGQLIARRENSQRLTPGLSNFGNQSNNCDADSSHDSVATAIHVAHPKPVTPYDSRTAIRDQLWKHVETAKERSLSQANIRTVLYDPFQSQPSPAGEEEPEKVLAKQDQVPTTFSKNVAGHTLQPPPSFDPASSKFFPTVLAPQIVKPSSPAANTLTNNLQDSSPDPYPTNSYKHNTPLIMTSSDSRPTPQTLKGPFFPAEQDLRSHLGVSTSSNIGKKEYDEELNDWWTSGNNFARQEEFFQSIASLRKDSFSMTSSPPAHLTPIGPPSRTPKKQEPPFNTTTTRLLIPMYENLSSYVQGPIEKRRDYFSQWSKPPEWCIDRSENGNNSFYDNDWGTPPARVGRDPRYSGRGWPSEHTPQRGRFGSPASGFGGGVSVGGGLDRRFGFVGGY